MPTNKRVKVLVVDDDRTMNALLCHSLQRAGYDTVSVQNGLDALETLITDRIDIVLLDIMMPEMDGFQTCAEIRKRSTVPVVMLTALSQTDNIVCGLQTGADHYVLKPFVLHELLARFEAVLRRARGIRSSNHVKTLLSLGGVTIDPGDGDKKAIVSGETVPLTQLEFELLKHLMTHAGKPVSKAELLEDIWGYPPNGDTNIVEVCMYRLRSKIEPTPSKPKCLITVHGIGYKFCAP